MYKSSGDACVEEKRNLPNVPGKDTQTGMFKPTDLEVSQLAGTVFSSEEMSEDIRCM